MMIEMQQYNFWVKVMHLQHNRSVVNVCAYVSDITMA